MRFMPLYACIMMLAFSHSAQAQEPANHEPSLPPTLDEQFIALAEQVPGFGGLYNDPETGRVVVHLTDLAQAATARDVVSAFLMGVSPVPLAGTSFAPPAVLTARTRKPEITFVKGEYDFRDLMTWRRQIEGAFEDLMTRSDVDEVKNRVALGVFDEAARSTVAGGLQSLGIPPEAILLEVVPPAIDDSLQGYARPVRGGLQVKALPWAPGSGECSLGYVALREYPGQVYDFSGPRYVITAAHCTSAFGVNNGDVIGQPTQADRIGVEYSDPPLTSNSTDSACPSSANECRRSDAALFLLDDNSSSTSTFNGVATASGLTLTGTAYYAGKQQGFAANQRVAKIGRTTGQTSGQITSTCSNIWFSSPYNRWMVCQMEATYSSQGGDSGAPVWYTDLSGNRWITGIHVGRTGGTNRAIFSMWMDAYSEIANDVLARTGVQWMPALTTGPANFSTQ